MKARWWLFAFNVAMVAINIAVSVAFGRWYSAAVAVFPAFVAGTLIGGNREYRRDHRDRGDTGPGASTRALARIPTGTLGAATTGPRVIDEPLKGWKVASLARYKDNQWSLFGYGGPYGVEAVAECHAYSSRKHDVIVPDPSCSCGFYALKAKPSHVSASSVLLEVELYGRVIVATDGYRAEKQRVLAIYGTPASLYKCEGQGTEIYNSQYGPQHQACERPAQYEARGRYWCATHAVEQPYRFTELHVEAPDIGTEWHWRER